MTVRVLVARAILAMVIGSFLAPVTAATAQQASRTYPAEWYAAGLHDSGNRYTGPGTQVQFEWGGSWSPTRVAFTQGGEWQEWAESLVLATEHGSLFDYWSPKWTRLSQLHNPFIPSNWIAANGLGYACGERGKVLWTETLKEGETQSSTPYQETTEGLLVYLDGRIVYLEGKNVLYAWSASSASASVGGGGHYLQSSVRLTAPRAEFVEAFVLAQEQIWRGGEDPFRLLSVEQASNAVDALFEANSAPCGIAPITSGDGPAEQATVSPSATNPLGDVTWFFGDATNSTQLADPVDVGYLWACFESPVAQTAPPYTITWFYNGAPVAGETIDPGDRRCFEVHDGNGSPLAAGQWSVAVSDANGLTTLTPAVELSVSGTIVPGAPGPIPTTDPDYPLGTCAPHPMTGQVPEGCGD